MRLRTALSRVRWSRASIQQTLTILPGRSLMISVTFGYSPHGR